MRRADVGGVALSAAVAALVAAAAFFGHGSSDARLFWLGAAALFLTGVGWILRPAVLSREGVAFFAFAAAFVVWQAVSIHWSIQPAGSWDYANRGLVYLGFAGVGALLGGVPRARIGEALAALLGLVAVVAAVAWLVIERDRLDSFPALVAAVPLAGIVAGIGLALPGIANDGQSHATRLRDGLIFGAIFVIGAVGVAFASRWAPEVGLR